MQLLADLLTNCRRNTSSGRQASLVLGNVEIRFVQRQRFHQIGVSLENLAHHARDRPVSYEIWREKDSAGAQAFRTNRRHGRAHPKASRFIRSSTNNRTAASPSDDDRLAAQLRIIPLFDGRIKCVHVHVDDFADAHLATILFLFPGRAVSESFSDAGNLLDLPRVAIGERTQAVGDESEYPSRASKKGMGEVLGR